MRPDVYNFPDYLAFLSTWISFLKENGEPKISLRGLASLASLSPAALSLGLNRKQELSEKSFEKILPHLQLHSQEIEFLRLLRKSTNESSEEHRTAALNELLKDPKYQAAHKQNFEVFEYLSSWVFVLIHEMVQLNDFEEDVKAIQSRSLHPLSREEVRRALIFLEGAGFIKRDKNLRFRTTQKNLKCDSGVFGVSLKNFHRTMLQLAEKSIKSTESARRNLQGLTLKVSAERRNKINEIINEAFDKIEKISAEKTSTPQEIYHLEMAFFPLTR